MSDYQEVRTTQHEEGKKQRAATFKATHLIWLFIGILEVLIGLRVFFKLIGVNADNPFASFLYGLTGFFVAPFASLLGAPAVGRMVFEISSIIAMIVYLLIAYGLERIIFAVFYRPRGPVTMRQTVVSEHIPSENVTQSVISNTSPNRVSSASSRTTVTERNLPEHHTPRS